MGTNPVGRQPTKRINMYKDHEFVIGKLVLGVNETLESYAVLGGAGLYATPAECAEECHWLNFELKGMMAEGSNRGLCMTLHQGKTGTAAPVVIRGTAKIATLVGVSSVVGLAGRVEFGAVKPVAANDFTTIGAGLTGQFTIPNRTLTGGTPAAIMGSIHCAGTSSLFGCTNPSLLWLRVTGADAATRRKVNTLMYVEGETGNKANKYLVCNADVNGGGASDGGIQINVNGTQMWLATYGIA